MLCILANSTEKGKELIIGSGGKTIKINQMYIHLINNKIISEKDQIFDTLIKTTSNKDNE